MTLQRYAVIGYWHDTDGEVGLLGVYDSFDKAAKRLRSEALNDVALYVDENLVEEIDEVVKENDFDFFNHQNAYDNGIEVWKNWSAFRSSENGVTLSLLIVERIDTDENGCTK